MSEKAISVAMTTCNGEQFLSKQLDSILSQTLQPSEIIICDDVSSDKTIEILKHYQKNYGILLFLNEHRLGVVNNFKKAVSLAKPGNYIALCDQDDIWLPKKLEMSSIVLSEIDDCMIPAMVYSDLIVIDQHDNVLSSSLNNELGFDKYQHCLSTLLFGNFALGCTVMMNSKMREFFNDIPGDYSFIHDAWITLIAYSFGKVASLQQPYILYRKHKHNVTFSNHVKSKRIDRAIHHLKSVFVQNNYLHEQFILLEIFYSMYQHLLTESQINAIMTVLKLENTSYIKKKIVFEKLFKNKWINRF